MKKTQNEHEHLNIYKLHIGTYRIIKVCKIFPPNDIATQKIMDRMIAKLQAINPRKKYIKGKPSP
jgi:hypothetical protein